MPYGEKTPPTSLEMAVTRNPLSRSASRNGSELPALGSNPSKPRWMTAQARMFGTLHPLQTRDGQDDCPAQRPAALCVADFGRSRPRPLIEGKLGARGRIKHIGSYPPGCRRDCAYIIPATPDARPASCRLRLGGECLDRHRGAWRTSLPQCTWSPCCPWPDRK